MFWDYIKEDSYRVTGRQGLTFMNFLRAYRNQGFRYLFFMRIYSFHRKNKLAVIFSRIMMRHYSYKFGFQVPGQTVMGKGIYFGHFGTVVINELATIGNFCNINHNITIGRQNRGDKKGAPSIGNKVWIGTGSVIVGKITIGDDVLIAPNAYVNFDVPPNSIVIGNPARIIEKNNPTQDYINNVGNFPERK